jgi:hypothetical protein
MAPEAHAPLPVPAPIVERAAALEGFATVTNVGVTVDPIPSTAPAPPASESLVHKVIALLEEKSRSPVIGSIIQAIKAANSVRSAPVWNQLCLLAAKGRDPGLKYKDEQTLWIPSSERDGENLTQKSFTQFLRRYRHEASKNSDCSG